MQSVQVWVLRLQFELTQHSRSCADTRSLSVRSPPHICIIEEVRMAQPYIGYFCDHPLALNYNARATADSASRLIPASGLIAAPWSCIFPRYICNDVTAANWVSNATRMDVQGVSIRPIAIPALCRYGGCTDLTVRRGAYDMIQISLSLPRQKLHLCRTAPLCLRLQKPHSTQSSVCVRAPWPFAGLQLQIRR